MKEPYFNELLKFLPEGKNLVLDSEWAYSFIVIYNTIVEPKPDSYNWENPEMDKIFSEFDIKITDKPSAEINTVWFYTSTEECKAYAFLRHIRNAISHNTISKKENNYKVIDLYFKDSKNKNIEFTIDMTMNLNITIENFWPLIVRTLQTLKYNSITKSI